MSTELTKDSRKTLKLVYDLYLGRRKSGQSKSIAKRFDAPRWGSRGPAIEGMEDAADELRNAGFIETDILGGFELLDAAIIYMENFTKDSVLKLVDFGTKFIP